MELPVSGKTASFSRKLHIKKGYYTGELMEVKPRQKEDGTPVEGTYGRQIVMLWKILDPKTQKPMVVEVKEDDTATKQVDVVIAQVLNSEYKYSEGDQVKYRTAVTPKAYITKVFKALGWVFDETKPLKLDSFVGKRAELNIDDYDAKVTKQDGQGNDVEETYKASSVKDVNKLEEEGEASPPSEPSEPSKGSEAIPETNLEPGDNLHDVEKNKEIDEKQKSLAKRFAEGSLTQGGYETAYAELEKMRPKKK